MSKKKKNKKSKKLNIFEANKIIKDEQDKIPSRIAHTSIQEKVGKDALQVLMDGHITEYPPTPTKKEFKMMAARLSEIVDNSINISEQNIKYPKEYKKDIKKAKKKFRAMQNLSVMTFNNSLEEMEVDELFIQYKKMFSVRDTLRIHQFIINTINTYK